MAVTPAFAKGYSQETLFKMFLNTLGCRNLGELKTKLVPSVGEPDTDGTSIDYHIVVDVTTGTAYLHTTGTTYTKMKA